MKGSVVHLTRRYPEDPRFQRMIDLAVGKVNEINRNAAAALSSSRAIATAPPEAAGAARKYLTSGACKDCHQEAYRTWDHSAHATAMQTLAKASQDYNPECLKCHTTGYGAPEGFQTARTTPSLINVQCEACHGGGAVHLQDTAKTYGRVAPRVCYTCHTRENSPEFSFPKYWEQIKH
jgi:hypothetical protein